jgi:hypothetical protein
MPLGRHDLPLDARITGAVLGSGALAFGLLGLVAPRKLAEMMATDEDTARAVGFRDTGNALAFLLAPTSAAALQRGLYDIGDALAFGRRKPTIMAGALSFAVLSAWTAWRAR